MGVLKEWRCLAHGEFENESGDCSSGCPADFVTREFRTAPAHKSAGTSWTDRELGNLAKDYGLSDLKNDKDGSSVMSSLKREKPLVDQKWGDISSTWAKPGWTRDPDAPKPKPMSVPGTFGNHLSGQNGLEGFKFGGPAPSFVGRPRDNTPLKAPE